ncbi:MAG TPA: hypothetical protein PLR73_04240 [Acetivibrio sp.]|nr:hypothetical protein [Acetivibrio sp.]
MKGSKLYKKSGILTLAIVLGIAVVHIVQIVNAASTAEPGSEDDPVVSQSYVDEQINSLKSSLDEMTKKYEEAQERLKEIESYGKFVPLELNKGQVLIAGESAEIILRGGKALAIGGEGGGLSDITSGSGADVNTDQEVPLNHLLLISRNDGRGIKVVSEKAWVLVKGPYTIN